MAQMRIFVSHSSVDDAFCRALVAHLRRAGADVWYDEHNLGTGVLRREIMRELAERPVFLVVLSRSAFKSDWVQDECEWAFNIFKRKPERLMLPVVADNYDRDDFDTLLYIESMRRVEAPGHKPFPQTEAIERTLHLLQLTLPGEAPLPTAPQPAESVKDLITRGKALQAQERHAEALPLFQRATQFDPHSFTAWFNVAYTFDYLQRYQEAVDALDRALAIDPNGAFAWTNKGAALTGLKRYNEALVAYDRALALDPKDETAWTNRGATLGVLERLEEALEAMDRALALDPNHAVAWGGKGATLVGLKRYDEALMALDRALALDPNDQGAWNIKGSVLVELTRYQEAVDAYDKALALDPKFAHALSNKAIALRALGRRREAKEAVRRAKELGG
jgi:tetratricopeptide (TPR) repeat protein